MLVLGMMETTALDKSRRRRRVVDGAHQVLPEKRAHDHLTLFQDVVAFVVSYYHVKKKYVVS